MFLTAFIWCCVVVVIIYLLVTEPEIRGTSGQSWIAAMFFLSGFPALIYQIVWQRVLAIAFGSNVESVTVIVTSFILGLGLGSLLAGWISSRVNSPLFWFALLEICTGLIGAVSLVGLRWLTAHTASLSVTQTAVVAFFVLLLPTALMGGTLPFLLMHLLRNSRPNVGRSLALLYFVNTLGSALACFISAQLGMRLLGESGTVRLAFILNMTVGIIALLLVNRTPSSAVVRQEALISPTLPNSLPYPVALSLAAISGFVALGYEILWYRVYAVAGSDRAPVFAFVLGAYLLGLALGSLVVESQFRSEALRGRLNIVSVGWLLIVFNICAFAVVPVLSIIAGSLDPQVALILVTVAAGSLGSAFPMIAHLSIPPDRRAGFHLGGLYFANMFGSALGSLAIGYVLADFWPLRRLAIVLLLAGLGCGACILLSQHRFKAVAVALLLAGALTLSAKPLYHDLYGKLLFKAAYRDGTVKAVVENRNGVIAVGSDDAVYGDGVYDGRFNVDLLHDTNDIARCFAISSFHPHPRNVLVIGLGSGSWAQVLANHPDVQHVTIVEINPGYLKLIAQYPQISGLLRDNKIEIAIDDGRRWLRAHRNRSFDLIVINSSFFWRSRSTNLLSTEFLQLARLHLQPGGVLFYNTTGSPRVQLTGVTTFRYGVRVANFLAASDSPLRLDKERLVHVLTEYRLNGKAVLNLQDAHELERLDQVLQALTPVTVSDNENFWSAEYAESIRHRARGLEVITDDNMGDEW